MALAASSLSSSSLRLFSLKPPLKPYNPFSTKTLIIFSSSFSFQRLSNPSPIQPIKSHHQSHNEIDISLLPPSLLEITALFQSSTNPKDKYQQLLHYGNQLEPLDPRYKTDEHRVQGCVSQVWVRAYRIPHEPGVVGFQADSDSALTKGLAALLVKGLSGSTADVISGIPPDFVHLLGLRQSLTPSRNNGFLNMLRLMQRKALELEGLDSGSKEGGFNNSVNIKDLDVNGVGVSMVDGVSEGKDSILVQDDERDVNDVGGSMADGVLEGKDSILMQVVEPNFEEDERVVNGIGRSMTDGFIEGKDSILVQDVEPSFDEKERDGVDAVSSNSGGGRAERIREKLEIELSPVELAVEDMSHLHAGHAGVRGSSGGETHFNVRVVSKEFEGKSLVKRHRLVYKLLEEELQSGLHALSIDAKTPSEVKPS